jgi:hypothetical protein
MYIVDASQGLTLYRHEASGLGSSVIKTNWGFPEAGWGKDPRLRHNTKVFTETVMHRSHRIRQELIKSLVSLAFPSRGIMRKINLPENPNGWSRPSDNRPVQVENEIRYFQFSTRIWLHHCRSNFGGENSCSKFDTVSGKILKQRNIFHTQIAKPDSWIFDHRTPLFGDWWVLGRLVGEDRIHILWGYQLESDSNK